MTSSSDPAVVTRIPTKDIRMRFRLREPKDDRVKEISESIERIGLINPLTISKDGYLIAGYHRLAAVKLLGQEEVDVIIKDTTKTDSELIEIDENLKRISLNWIEKAEHIVRREELLEELGLRMKRGGNQYSTGLITTSALADQIGVSNRVYRLWRQPAEIEEEVRDELRSTTFADHLKDMVLLSQQDRDIQLEISKLLITGKCQTFKRAFVQANLREARSKNDYKIDFDMKERWGIPHSIMNFKKADVELQNVCDLVAKDPELEWNKRGRGLHFGASRIPVYGMCADHSEFLVTYYTPEDGLVLDNFMGRGTNVLASLWHGRRVIGYDVHKPNVDRLNEVINEQFKDVGDRCQLFHSDGTALEELKDEAEYLDAVVTDPPYVHFEAAEVYSEDDRDLSHMNNTMFMDKIRHNFKQLHRLIKTSSFEDKIFYPVIFKVGTGRQGKYGIIDMDADFQAAAKEAGFVLWDKVFNQLQTPFGSTNWERNYINKYVQKNYEVNLVFCKFK